MKNQANKLRVKRKGEPGYPFAVLGAPHPVDGGDYAPLAVCVEESDARLFAAAPALYAALKGAQSALRKALPFVPPDSEGIYCGEWLDEINAALALVE